MLEREGKGMGGEGREGWLGRGGRGRGGKGVINGRMKSLGGTFVKMTGQRTF